MNRDTALAQYYSIDYQIKQLEKRKETVRKWLLDNLLADQHEVKPGSTINTQHRVGNAQYNIQVQVKRRTKIDRGLLEQVIDEKGLWDSCTSEQLDDDLIEEAFILGKLTDEDIRSIQGDSTPILSLKVEKEVNDIV